MIWADKVGLFAAAAIAAAGLLAFAALLIGVGTMTAVRLNLDALEWIALIDIAVALPLWLLLRAIDVITGGPWRRRRRAARAPQREPNVSSAAGRTEPAAPAMPRDLRERV